MFLSVKIFILVALKQKKALAVQARYDTGKFFTLLFGMHELLGILLGVLKNSNVTFSVK